MAQLRSRYYQVFKEEEIGEAKTLYEKIISLIPKVARLDTGFGLEKDYDPILKQAQLSVTTADVITLTVYTILLGLFVGTFILTLLGFDSLLAMVIYGTALFVGAATMAYPALKAQRNKMLIVGQSPLVILYMVISLRVTPTIENALLFAAKNVPDPMGREMKEIAWKVQTRVYSSVAEALYSYSANIKKWAPGFSDALYLIVNSVEQPTAKDRERTLEKAIQVSLEYTKSVMGGFARGLSLPVMATNALGIILPVLGLVMAPIASIFMKELSMSLLLPLVYNIVLPIVLLSLMAAILSGRPGSFSIIDLSLYPNVKDLNKTKVFGIKITYTVLGIIIFLLVGGPTLLSIITQGSRFFEMTTDATDSLKTIPLLIGAGLGLGVALLLGNKKKTKLAKEIKEVEHEFSSALYQLSNIMQQGMPLEQALYEASYALKGTKSARFFQTGIENIEKFGLPPYQAFFDSEVGAIRLFPSSLIRNILEIVLSASQRSTAAAATAIQSISVYLQNIQRVENKIDDLLSESISTMKFQSYVLIPLISGVVVGLSQMITQILMKVTEQMNTAFAGSSLAIGGSSMMGGFLNIQGAIPPSFLQLVVGFFTLELLFLIGLFAGGLEKSIEDQASVKAEMGQLISIGVVVYTIITTVVAIFFSGLMVAVL